MKKKEFTKFLALMMSAAMVAGSGVPVTAADFSSDDVVVETIAESDDAETADEADDAQIELGGGLKMKNQTQPPKTQMR